MTTTNTLRELKNCRDRSQQNKKMGNSCSGLPPDCEIIVKTGDVKGAGTDANVYCALYNEDKSRSRDLNLDCKWKNDFEKGAIDRFKVHCGLPPGPLHKLEIWRDDSGIGDDWYVEWIKVKKLNNPDEEEPVIFPCNRWVKAKRKMVLTIYDCVLPQFDEHAEQRKQELEDKRDVYRMARKAPGIPKQVEVFVYSCIINPRNLQKQLIFRGLHNNNITYNYATRLFELRVKNRVIPEREF